MKLKIIGTPNRWKNEDGENQVSWDNGKNWFFTFRGERETREMWRAYEIEEINS